MKNNKSDSKEIISMSDMAVMGIVSNYVHLIDSHSSFRTFMNVMEYIRESLLDVKITVKQAKQLQAVKGKFILCGGKYPMKIQDYKIEIRTRKNIFGKSKQTIILKSVEFHCYDNAKGTFGKVDIPVLNFVASLDIANCRNTFLHIARTLEHAGYEIRPLAFEHNDYY